jgi:hypothetical protein
MSYQKIWHPVGIVSACRAIGAYGSIKPKNFISPVTSRVLIFLDLKNLSDCLGRKKVSNFILAAHFEHAQHRRRGALRAVRQDGQEQVVPAQTQGTDFKQLGF